DTQSCTEPQTWRNGCNGGEGPQRSEVGDLAQWLKCLPGKSKAVKRQLLERAQGQLMELLDQTRREAIQSYPTQDRPVALNLENCTTLTSATHPSSELMEVQHFCTIYHIFAAGLCVFIISTVATDFIDEGRLVLEFDVLCLVMWIPMFLSLLLVPYQALWLWPGLCAAGCPASMLCILLIHVVLKQELLPASRCVLVRLLMKSYSFLRETMPGTLRVRGGGLGAAGLPYCSSIRWNYVAKNFSQALCCVLYACFILGHLCVPVFANMSREPFSPRALVLFVLHGTLPGIFMLLLIFFTFLHSWLNAFTEMLQFGDQMFYGECWTSTSFSNYYHTWNVVVHGRLYSYCIRTGLGKTLLAREADMIGAFLVSAVVYIFCFVLGFYPILLLNFTMNDHHTGPTWNVLMWTLLFLGQGIQVSLYCQEWYARRHSFSFTFHPSLAQTTFWDLVTPWSWSCHP
uniref:O-acyltransferase n=1 Tax=Cavia porcellus TaxID=10141 RepID=H0V5W6_CAVPO